MPEDLETIKEATIKEEPTIPKKKGRPFKVIENEEKVIEEKVPKKRGRPLKQPLITDYKPKPRGRPPKNPEEKAQKKTKEEMRIYHKNYFEEHKDQIIQKRIEYRKTENYKQLRHMQNERYKARLAQRPKVCLIDITKL